MVPAATRPGRPNPKAMSGDAVAKTIQCRAAEAWSTPAQVEHVGGHYLRSRFAIEAFGAGATPSPRHRAGHPPQGFTDARGVRPNVRTPVRQLFPTLDLGPAW